VFPNLFFIQKDYHTTIFYDKERDIFGIEKIFSRLKISLFYPHPVPQRGSPTVPYKMTKRNIF
jgi:hypothetical protein